MPLTRTERMAIVPTAIVSLAILGAMSGEVENIESNLNAERGAYGSFQAYGNQLFGLPIFFTIITWWAAEKLMRLCGRSEDTGAAIGSGSSNAHKIALLLSICAFIGVTFFEGTREGPMLHASLENGGYSSNNAGLLAAADAIGEGTLASIVTYVLSRLVTAAAAPIRSGVDSVGRLFVRNANSSRDLTPISGPSQLYGTGFAARNVASKAIPGLKEVGNSYHMLADAEEGGAHVASSSEALMLIPSARAASFRASNASKSQFLLTNG